MRWKKTRNLAFDKRTSRSAGKEATGKLLTYLSVTQKRSLAHIQKAVEYQPDHF